MDFLGLKTLTLIKDTVKIVKAKYGIDLDPDNFPIDDKKTFELFQRGETVGIFQYESPGMQKHLKDLKPSVFDDLIAMNALYRPGPMEYIPSFIRRKHGDEKIVYDLPEMEEYLKDTYGITVYQEQVMLLSQKIGNFSKGEADILRKAMGKKQKDVLDKMKPKFLKNSEKKGFKIEKVEKIWKDWEAFASYAFNKSHSTCYAWIAYQTAFLKANYPAEYIAACLTAVKRDKDRTAIFLSEARDMGVKVSTPDVNLSSSDFTVNDNEILFGLSAVRNVGDITADKIVLERESNGDFESIEDFLSRIDSRSLNKRGVEALIQGGGLDKFGHTRKGMFDAVIDLIENAKELKATKENNQVSLFPIEDANSTSINIKSAEWDKKELLEREREMLGFFVSEDPLEGYGEVLKSESTHSIIELQSLEDEEEINVTISGLISNVQKRVSRRGNPWIQFDIQDLTGSSGVLLFNKLVDKYNASIDGEIYLKVSGTYVGGSENTIRARDIDVIEPSKMIENLDISPLRISVDEEKLDKKNLVLLKELLEKFPGLSSVELEVNSKTGSKLLELKEIRVKKTNQLKNEISTLLAK
mgnify:CR=1 FL=1